jgi:hypothetical protein
MAHSKLLSQFVHDLSPPHLHERETGVTVKDGNRMRLDILSAILTVLSMTQVGQKRWQGWALAFANSVVVCILAVHVVPKQWALIPPNVLCLFIYARNLWNWKQAEDLQYKKAGRAVMAGRAEARKNLVGCRGEVVTKLGWFRRGDAAIRSEVAEP